MVATLYVCQKCGAGYSKSVNECRHCGNRYITPYNRALPTETIGNPGRQRHHPLDDDVIIRNVERVSRKQKAKLKKVF